MGVGKAGSRWSWTCTKPCSALPRNGKEAGITPPEHHALGFISEDAMKYALGGFAVALAAALCVGMAGCSRAPAQVVDAGPPTVTVSHPVEQEVTDYADYTGRIAAVDSVEVRAHVW